MLYCSFKIKATKTGEKAIKNNTVVFWCPFCRVFGSMATFIILTLLVRMTFGFFLFCFFIHHMFNLNNLTSVNISELSKLLVLNFHFIYLKLNMNIYKIYNTTT